MTLADRVWTTCGLEVKSPVPLAGVPSDAVQPDLTIRIAEAEPARVVDRPGRLLGSHVVDDRLTEMAYEHEGVVTLVLPGYLVASYDLREAVCEVAPDPTLGAAMLQRLLGGPVLATWMILNHLPMLHASAVQIDGRAVLFVGSSGSGKTTIAAALVAMGGVMIADDVCGLAQRDGGWVCFPDAGELRLRAGSADLAAMLDRTAVANVEGRTTVSVRPSEEPVIIDAIVLPQISREVRQIVANRLQGTRSVLALLEHPRMGSLLGNEFSGPLFRFASTLVSTVPVWDLQVPWTAAVTPEIGKDLVAAITQLRAALLTQGGQSPELGRNH